MLAFEKLQSSEYTLLNTTAPDSALDTFLGKRVQMSGRLVWSLTRQKNELVSYIQTAAVGKEYRYVKLAFPSVVGTHEGLEQQGLVKGNSVRIYGFLERVDKHWFSKNEYGINPVEAWEIEK